MAGTEIDKVDPGLVQQAPQDVAIGIVDFAGRDGLAGLAQLGPGREGRDTEFAEHLDLRQSRRCGKAHHPGIHLAAMLDQDGAGLNVFAAQPDIGAASRRMREHDIAVARFGVFLGDDGIRAGRNRRAGQYPDRGAGFQPRFLLRRASRDPPDQPQRCRQGTGEVFDIDRVAVHRTGIEAGQWRRCHQIPGQNPSRRILDGDSFRGDRMPQSHALLDGEIDRNRRTALLIRKGWSLARAGGARRG